MSFEVETSPDADMVDLTICTVYTPNLEPYLRLNWELISTLNRRNNWRWLIVDNSEEPEKLFQLGDGRCGTIAGVPKDMAIAEAQRKSYHHAAAFQKSLKHINTRFVLFLDPDFFLLQNEILSDALSYMIDNDLGFLGVPYHPKWYSKIRYFPTVFCMFIDLSTVPIESLNFTPSLKFSKGKKQKKVKNLGPTIRRPLPVRAWNYLLNHTTRRISRWTKLTIQRRRIGGSKDTGYPIYSHYRSHKKIANECMVPVYDPQLEFTGAKLALSPANRFIERFLPDRLCYLPKDPDYFTKLGFHEQGYPDVQSKTWEEYLWHGKPFGFHLRQTRQDQLGLAKHHRFLTETLDHFINLELAATVRGDSIGVS